MKIRQALLEHKWQFVLLLLLVLLDAGLLVLFPIFIGNTIDDALTQEYRGAIYLALLGFVTLLIGAGRRFYDSRFYAKIYEQLGIELGGRRDKSASEKSAHLGFLTEVVEFFEGTLPEIVSQIIGLLGTLIIIWALNLKIFVGCLIIMLIVVVIYGMTEKRTTQFNASYNNELEMQVTVVSDHYPILLRRHLAKLMKWNIKLSDLETINFSVAWLFMMIFLVLSIITAVGDGLASYGVVLSLVLYLFQFIETTAVLPAFYQQWLRLTEITSRLKRV